MIPKIKGKVAYVFEQPNFDADLICGLDNCTVADRDILKEVCMKDIAPDFQNYVEPGDVVVCAENKNEVERELSFWIMCISVSNENKKN